VPHPVDPGKHEYQAFAEGMESAPTNVSLKEGVRETVVLTLSPTEPAAEPGAGDPAKPAPNARSGGTFDASTSDSGDGMSGMQIGSIVGFGVGAVGIGLGTFFMISSSSTRADVDSLFEDCIRNGCTPAQEQVVEDTDADADGQRTLGVASFVVGGLGVATGITLLLLDSEEGEIGSRLQPTIGLGYAGMRGKF
jgi:hypothetical protein